MASVTLDDVTVEYPIYNVDTKSLRSNLLYFGSGGALKPEAGRRMKIVALDGVTLHASHGDRIGLIGRNGAGKSTLLRVLAGIYAPGRGRVRIEGSVATMLGSGLPLDDDLTGYEAIDFGGLLLGMTRDQIEAAKPDIVGFTELGEYMSMPLRTYSNGMKTRLAFAIATARRPDILLIDEAIGAGDAHFVAKARTRALDFMGSSSILFIASHAPDIVDKVCNKAVLLEHGAIRMIGSVAEVMDAYRHDIPAPSASPAAVPVKPAAAPPAAWQRRVVGDWQVRSDDDGAPLAVAGTCRITAGRYRFAADGSAEIALTARDSGGRIHNERFAGRYRATAQRQIEVEFDRFREVFLLAGGGKLFRIETNRPTWETRLELQRAEAAASA